MTGGGPRSALLPFALLWLAAHAALLAIFLGLKFAVIKLAVVMLLLATSVLYLVRRFRPGPRKLSYSPAS